MSFYKVIGCCVLQSVMLCGCCECKPSAQEQLTNKNDTFSYCMEGIIKSLKESYVSEYTEEELTEKAIKGLLANLDPHTCYLDENDFKDLQIHSSGEFQGIGTQIVIDNGLIRIVAPLDDGPAYKAGLKSGDYILCVNDEYISGVTSDEAAKLLRGKKGSKVKLKIKRHDEPPFDVTITRNTIKLESVKHEIVDDVMYVRISSFDQTVSAKLTEAIKKAKAGGKLKGLVLDMRDNPGGLLEEACKVTDLFLNGGLIVSTKGRDPAEYKKYSATKGDILDGLPIAVLVNSGTASAPEIVAGALQDNKRAIIVGTRTFGKGSVQRVAQISPKTAIRVTLAMHYTPSGRCIQGQGISPDIQVNPAIIKEAQGYVVMREENLKNALVEVNGKLVNKKTAKVLKEEVPDNPDQFDNFLSFVRGFFAKGKNINNEEIRKKINELEKKNDDDFEIAYRSMTVSEKKEKDLQLRTAFDTVETMNWVMKRK